MDKKLYNAIFGTERPSKSALPEGHILSYPIVTTNPGDAVEKAWTMLRTGRGAKSENAEVRKAILQVEQSGKGIYVFAQGYGITKTKAAK